MQARLEDLTDGPVVTGLVPGAAVTVVAAKWAGSRLKGFSFASDHFIPIQDDIKESLATLVNSATMQT